MLSHTRKHKKTTKNEKGGPNTQTHTAREREKKEDVQMCLFLKDFHLHGWCPIKEKRNMHVQPPDA